ncbi:MAG: hypothetical protein HYY01_11990 [Chloroflexi bacterium]|nr:hypothetical protein [Chloroflexota bacterium]
MATYKRQAVGTDKATEVTVRLQALQSAETRKSLKRLRQLHGKHALPAAEVRRMLDEALGARTLTEELHQLREQ